VYVEHDLLAHGEFSHDICIRVPNIGIKTHNQNTEVGKSMHFKITFDLQRGPEVTLNYFLGVRMAKTFLLINCKYKGIRIKLNF